MSFQYESLIGMEGLTMFASSRLMPELLKADTALKAPTHLLNVSKMEVDGLGHYEPGIQTIL